MPTLTITPRKRSLALSFAAILWAGAAEAQTVLDYAPFFAECRAAGCGKRLIVRRTRVVSYGLVPIGSDAWLAGNAKDQDPAPGSIVLIHGNGNEPLGIDRFLALLRQEKAAIRSGNWLLFDLRESVRLEEQMKKR